MKTKRSRYTFTVIPVTIFVKMTRHVVVKMDEVPSNRQHFRRTFKKGCGCKGQVYKFTFEKLHGPRKEEDHCSTKFKDTNNIS